MKTLTICARKGGVSKSLCTRSFAVQAAIAGLRSAILDLDPQETSVLWSKRRPHPAPAVEGIGRPERQSGPGFAQGHGGRARLRILRHITNR